MSRDLIKVLPGFFLEFEMAQTALILKKMSSWKAFALFLTSMDQFMNECSLLKMGCRIAISPNFRKYIANLPLCFE